MEARALQIEHLSYSYHHEWTRRKILALNDVTFSVDTGESFGFLGHNGAGKTTTIKCLLGLIRPVEGSIRINGIESTQAPARRQVGYVPEQPYFYDNLRVYEIMQLYAGLAGIRASERRPAIQEALAKVNATGLAQARMRTLSKGQAQRVAMAQAVVAKPRLLVLDEPFSGLDPLGRKEFRELLCSLKQSGTTIFMSSHILSDVEFLCDRVSILSRGSLKGVFRTRDIPNMASGIYELVIRAAPDIHAVFGNVCHEIKSEDRFVRLRFENRSDAEAALGMALQRKFFIESFEYVHGGLEELFVRLSTAAPG